MSLAPALSPTGVTSAVGRSVRLRRLLGEDGRAVFVALDQAIPRDVHQRLASIDETFRAVADGRPDGITMTRGIGARQISLLGRTQSWILKTSVFSLDFHRTRDAVIGSVGDAVRLGADAVAVGISLGSDEQADMLEMLAEVVSAAAEVGMPTICHAYPSGDRWGERSGSPEAVLYAARAAAEIGVDIVKTWYTGDPESFSRVVSGTPALVMTAGGGKAESIAEVLGMARGVMDAGGAGITFGRNVWDAPRPTSMVKALRSIVHDEATLDDALDVYAAG